MEKLNPIGILDSILKHFDSDNMNFEHPKEIYEKISLKISIKDFDMAIKKLQRDGYLDHARLTSDDKIDPPYVYRINFIGRLFSSKGGYRHRHCKNRNMEYFRIAQTWVILVATIFAAWYSIKEIFFSDDHLIENCIHYHIF